MDTGTSPAVTSRHLWIRYISGSLWSHFFIERVYLILCMSILQVLEMNLPWSSSMFYLYAIHKLWQTCHLSNMVWRVNGFVEETSIVGLNLEHLRLRTARATLDTIDAWFCMLKISPHPSSLHWIQTNWNDPTRQTTYSQSMLLGSPVANSLTYGPSKLVDPWQHQSYKVRFCASGSSHNHTMRKFRGDCQISKV